MSFREPCVPENPAALPPCASSPRLRRGLSLLGFLALWSGSPQDGALVRDAAAQPSPDARSSAKERFDVAVRYYTEGEAAQALPLFERLLAETDSPNAALYVGHCLVKLGRYVDAYRAYSRAVSLVLERNDRKYEPTKEAARAQLASLDLRVAKLVVVLAEVPNGIQVTIDGEELDAAAIGAPAILEPGDHVVEANVEGREPARREVHVDAGETKSVSLTLRRAEPEPRLTAPRSVAPPESPRHSSLRTAGYAGAGLGIAGFTLFTVAGVRARRIHDDLEASCGESACSDAAHREDASQGKTMQKLANTGLIAGAVGTIAAGTLLVLHSRSSRTRSATVSLTPGGATMTYRGAFR